MSEVWLAAIDGLAVEFHDIKLFALLEVPRFRYFPNKELIMRELGLRMRDTPLRSDQDHARDHAFVNAHFKALAGAAPNLEILDTYRLLCLQACAPTSRMDDFCTRMTTMCQCKEPSCSNRCLPRRLTNR